MQRPNLAPKKIDLEGLNGADGWDRQTHRLFLPRAVTNLSTVGIRQFRDLRPGILTIDNVYGTQGVAVV